MNAYVQANAIAIHQPSTFTITRFGRTSPTGANQGCSFGFFSRSCGSRQKPLWQTRRGGHPLPSPHEIGQGPTKHTGAEANKLVEPLPQNRSTGCPSHPQRPPGSKHEPDVSTTHLPLSTAPVKPQRCPEGHSELLLQLAPSRELLILPSSVPLVGKPTVEPRPHAMSRHSPQSNAVGVNISTRIFCSLPFLLGAVNERISSRPLS